MDGEIDPPDFVGRTAELERLERLWSTVRASACAITGPRGIGKTALAGKFCSDKRCLFLRFRPVSLAANQEASRLAVEMQTGEAVDGEKGSTTDAVERFCRAGRTVIVLDDYPSVSSLGRNVSKNCRRLMERLEPYSTLFIFTGSDSKMMREFENLDQELFGSLDSRIDLGPLPLSDTRELHPGMTDHDALLMHITLGGVPQYHKSARGNNYREAMVNAFVTPDAPLKYCSEAVLSEFSPMRRYASIVEAVASGCRKVTDVSTRSGYLPSSCSESIKDLEAADIIDRETPMLMGRRAARQLRCKDSVLAFTYGVLNKAYAARPGDAVAALDASKDAVGRFLSDRLARMSEEYLASNYGIEEIGTWRGEEGCIPVVAHASDGKNVMELFCDCSVMEVGREALDSLRSRISSMGFRGNCRHVLVSADGFSKELENEARDDGRVILIGPDHLFGKKPAPSLRP